MNEPKQSLGDRVHDTLKQHTDRLTSGVLLFYGFSLILFAFAVDTPLQIWQGMVQIVISPCGLITDYMEFAGIGAAFVNAGLVTISAVMLARWCWAPFGGMLIAGVFMSGGFAFFGKNIANIWPIILGVWLHCRRKGEPFSKHLHLAFFGTALGPLVSEMPRVFAAQGPLVGILAATVVGAAAGYILVPVSSHTFKFHRGYNLYNAGFACGLIATVAVSILRSFGYDPLTMFYWGSAHTGLLSVYLLLFFVLLGATGWWLDDSAWEDLCYITKHSGQQADFIALAGFPGTMVNMSLIGICSTFYIIGIGGQLNGPTAGCILAIAGFGAAGINLRNTLYIVLGVVLGSFVKIWSLTDPAVQLSVLLCTGLAPLAGRYGLFVGVLAGFIHSSVVMNVGNLYGALNLYNNGFSTGLVAAFLAPLISDVFRAREDPAPPRQENPPV